MAILEIGCPRGLENDRSAAIPRPSHRPIAMGMPPRRAISKAARPQRCDTYRKVTEFVRAVADAC